MFYLRTLLSLLLDAEIAICLCSLSKNNDLISSSYLAIVLIKSFELEWQIAISINYFSGQVNMAVIFGTELDDTLSGGDENDVLFGKAGNDISGGLGDDNLFGEDGNDT